jgi:hypothetical protein
LVSAAAVAIAYLRGAPARDDAALEAQLKRHAKALELEFAGALEKAADVGETIKRHRARIDGAVRKPEEPAEPTLWNLTAEQVARLPVEQQLAWASRKARHRPLQ